MLEPNVTIFVDGSCFRDHKGNHAGYELLQQTGEDEFQTEKAKKLPQPYSAQKAKHKALSEACLSTTSRTAYINTDSAYAHGICHLFRALWQQRGFRKRDGTRIQHLTQITELMTAMMQPKQLAITKCQAHKKDNLNIMKGNSAADEAAKLVAGKIREAIMDPQSRG